MLVPADTRNFSPNLILIYVGDVFLHILKIGRRWEEATNQHGVEKKSLHFILFDVLTRMCVVLCKMQLVRWWFVFFFSLSLSFGRIKSNVIKPKKNVQKKKCLFTRVIAYSLRDSYSRVFLRFVCGFSSHERPWIQYHIETKNCIYRTTHTHTAKTSNSNLESLR